MTVPDLSAPTPILTDFTPKTRLISAITNTANAQVTTTENHLYSDGLLVRIFIPEEYGMDARIYKTGTITVTSDTTFTTDLDLSAFSPFTTPSFPPAFTQAQVIPITGTKQNEAT